MNLKELQALIKEEFDALTQESDLTQEADDDIDVSVDSDEVEAEEKNPEDTLRNVFDMLKDYFEGEEEMGGEEMSDDVEGEDPEADLEEVAAQGFGDKGNKSTSGANVGFTPAKTTRGDGKLHESSKSLQERFQKLANIIK